MNTTLTKAIRLLVHPVSLAAAALIAFNDFILRPLAPSWWSGKLSDIGALIIWPLLFAAGLSLLLPKRLKNRDALAGSLALGMTLSGYLLLKSSALTNHVLLQWSGYLLRAVPDSSDLLALPALLFPAWLWFRASAAVPIRLRWEYLATVLILVIGLADAAAPDYGAACFFEENSQLIVSSGYYRTDTTADGGYTWAPTDFTPGERCDMPSETTQVELSAPGGVQYRVTFQEKVECRAAEGQNWEVIYTPQMPSQAENAYREQTESASMYYQPGPLDAAIEPVSGNLLLAMGLEGILLIEADGNQIWVPVAQYRHAGLNEDGWRGIVKLLRLEILLAFLVGLAWWNTATLVLDRTRWQIAWVVLGWVFLAPTLLLAHPDIVVGYFALGTMLGVLVSAVWLAAIVVTRIIRTVRREPKQLLRLALGIPVVAVLFFIPYVLWAVNILPDYWLAIMLGAILAAAGGWIIQRASKKKA